MDLTSFLQGICRYNFGTFERDEFKKFVRMGFMFFMIIGIYWTLRPLKDAIFIDFVGKYQIPYAKTISVLALLPLVMIYTRLLVQKSKETMLMILPAFYGTLVLCFTAAFLLIEQGSLASQVLAYAWYLFVESFGSLMVALFWAFSTDTTEPTQAKRGFPLVVAIGQVGGIIFPYSVGGLPHRLGHTTDTLSLLCLSASIFFVILLVRRFLRVTPKHLLVSTYSETEEDREREEKEEPGFLEGLKILLANRYLLGIFFANFIYEVVITIFDFNFKIAAATEYSGVALTNYLSTYGSVVNIVSLTCLLLGISNVTRFLGVGVALAAMPVIVGVALLGFLNLDSLSFLFALMVGSKAINYALNGPALKQLYIPTTPDVKFKAQAWIETFGSRTSKQVGSLFNMGLAPLQNTFGLLAGRSYYMMISGGVCFPLLALWFVIALYLGRLYKTAIRDKKTIC